MKKLVIFSLILASFLNLSATDWIDLNTGSTSENFSLISSDINKSVVHFTMDGFWKNEVATVEGTAWKISAENSGDILKKGAPEGPLSHLVNDLFYIANIAADFLIVIPVVT